MYTSKRYPHSSRPRAKGTATIPDELVKNIVSVLRIYGELPIHVIASFYRYEYNETLDASKINGGLPGLIQALPNIFVTRRDQDGFSMVSYERARTPEPVDERLGDEENAVPNLDSLRLVKEIRKKRCVNRLVNQLMDPNGFLWSGKPWARLLDKTNIILVESVYELARQMNPNLDNEVRQIRNYLSRFPDGRRICELAPLNAKAAIFNCAAICQLLDDFPEIFFKFEMTDGEPLVFDGSRVTVADLTGRDDNYFKGGPTPEEIVAHAVRVGLYQKTLILVNKASVAGLKINVWYRSMEENFYKGHDDKMAFASENKILGFNTLKFFLALARFDMIVLKPGRESKNDTRAFMPKRFITYDYLEKHIPGIGVNCLSTPNSEIYDSNGSQTPSDRHILSCVSRWEKM